MSWPHILSLSRVVASPIIAVLVISHQGDDYLIAALVFGLASFTDMIDGKLARYAKRVSPLGIFIDTTADKVLISIVLVSLALAHQAAAWIPLVVIGREFLISGLRSYAASCDHIISAHLWGKGKTLLTMIAIGAVLAAADGTTGGVLANVGSHQFWLNAANVASWLLGAAAILTVVSGIRYVVDAWPLFGREAVKPPRTVERAARVAASSDR